MTRWAQPDGLVQFRDEIDNDDIDNKYGLARVPVAARQQVEPENEELLN